jgi:hypothetical protein
MEQWSAVNAHNEVVEAPKSVVDPRHFGTDPDLLTSGFGSCFFHLGLTRCRPKIF